MLKLELDWAGDEMPELGLLSERDETVALSVELVTPKGPSGWPVIAVYASRGPDVPAYREAMELDGWLEAVYGEKDEDMRQELLGMAEPV